MRRPRLLFATLVFAITGLAIVVAPSASAAPATGCSGSAITFKGGGQELDRASAPGAGATSSDPLKVDLDGTIQWQGTTDQVLQHGEYKVTADGITIKSGKVTNDSGKPGSAGTEDVGDRLDKLPVIGKIVKALDPVVTIKVKYTVTGTAGSCSGTAVLQIGDKPEFTPLWFGSIGIMLISALVLFWPRGLIGG